MEFNMTRGLRFMSKPEYAGKMFLTEFEDEEARETINRVEAALRKLPLYYLMGGAYVQDAQAGERILQAIADDNPELYLYGLKAAVPHDLYFVSPKDRNNPNKIFMECLGEILGNTINSDPERWLPVFKHMLQVWPHSKYWRVVNDVLCRAYAGLEASDAECIRIIAQGLLRDPYSWRAAFDAMMIRAANFPGETTAQFGEVFYFLDIYGQSATGMDGISIPQDIFSRQDSTMQQAFRAQSDEVKQELRDIGAVTLGNNRLIRRYLSRMFGVNRSNEDIGDLETLFRTDPQAAKDKIQNHFNVRAMDGWEKLQSPKLVEWMGEKLADAHYSISEKQILGYMFCKRVSPNTEAARMAHDILYAYRPCDDSDQEYVLAYCFKMLAVASDSRRSVASDVIGGDMIELLTRHSDMEVNERDMLDKREKGAIWRNMISNYSLNDAMRVALASIISDTNLSDPEAVRRMCKIIADTFSPLEHDNPRVLRAAVPHDEFRYALNKILALDSRTNRFGANYDFLRVTLPKILDALESVSIQETYDRYYRLLVGHLHIYCTTLDDNSRGRIRDSYNRIMGLIHKFR